MTLYEFNALDDTKKYEIVFNVGTYLDVVINGSTRFALYAVNMFFVEIAYNNESNKITGCRSFKTGALLDKFSKF